MAEENKTPVSGATPPPANPLAKGRPATLKLKPVIRKPTIGGGKPLVRPGMKLPTQKGLKVSPPAPAAPAAAAAPAASAPAPDSMEQLKSVTQKLKGVTQQIPQQAILRKTGIIADQELTEAQKQASKSRTARISLSDAIGVAPVQNEAAPMKTIRIKRPGSLNMPPPASAPKAPAPAPAAAAPVEEPAAPAPAAPAAEKPTITQRKTLKIARPGAVRPSGKFGIKKPSAPAPAAAPAEGAAAPAEGEVADIPDIPDMPNAAPAPKAAAVPADAVPSVSKGAAITGIVFQLAACVVIGLLGYFLYQDAQLPLFCGGCGWGQ